MAIAVRPSPAVLVVVNVVGVQVEPVGWNTSTSNGGAPHEVDPTPKMLVTAAISFVPSLSASPMAIPVTGSVPLQTVAVSHVDGAGAASESGGDTGDLRKVETGPPITLVTRSVTATKAREKTRRLVMLNLRLRVSDGRPSPGPAVVLQNTCRMGKKSGVSGPVLAERWTLILRLASSPDDFSRHSVFTAPVNDCLSFVVFRVPMNREDLSDEPAVISGLDLLHHLAFQVDRTLDDQRGLNMCGWRRGKTGFAELVMVPSRLFSAEGDAR